MRLSAHSLPDRMPPGQPGTLGKLGETRDCDFNNREAVINILCHASQFLAQALLSTESNYKMFYYLTKSRNITEMTRFLSHSIRCLHRINLKKKIENVEIENQPKKVRKNETGLTKER